MKKLLVLLLIATLAAFVFTGCDLLPPADGDGDGDGDSGDGVVTAEITFDHEYEKAAGVVFIPCSDTVTVTLPEAPPADEFVYVAIKLDDTPSYDNELVLTPNADRTVWTGTWITTLADNIINECEMYCVAALIGHPCCSPEEVAVEVVIPDCNAPDIPVFEFDCGDCNACEEVCEPEGAYFTFTSFVDPTDPCDPVTDSCEDNCSGVGAWKFSTGGECDLCILAEGEGCPIEGTADCGCLPYAEEGTEDYEVIFEVWDKVGNKNTATYTITVDTDSVVTGTCMQLKEED